MLFSKKIKWIKNYLPFALIPHLQEDILSPLNSLIIFYKAERFIVLRDFSGGLSQNAIIDAVQLTVSAIHF